MSFNDMVKKQRDKGLKKSVEEHYGELNTASDKIIEAGNIPWAIYRNIDGNDEFTAHFKYKIGEILEGLAKLSNNLGEAIDMSMPM